MSVLESMLTSVRLQPKSVKLQLVDTPEPQPGQVLMRVAVVGVCWSDTHFYETGVIGDIVGKGPIVLRHDAAGEIVTVGKGADPRQVGTQVTIEPQTPCRKCSFCKEGSYHLCTDMRFYGASPVDGSFSDYELVDDDLAHAVPSTMTSEEAALVEPVSVAVHAGRAGKVASGSRFLITGAGQIGVFCGQVARAFGATEVVISDPVPNRRDYASVHGTTGVVGPAEEDLKRCTKDFDVYVDASGKGGQSSRPSPPSGHTVRLF